MHNSDNDTCVFVVVYPSMEKWIPDFTRSLLKQDCKNFDLLIVNDGLDIEKLILCDHVINCKILPSGGSIAKNRSIGFSYMFKSGYRYVVFADADDLMASNRISCSIELLKNYDIVVNDLAIISSDTECIMDQYLSRRLGNSRRINLDEIIDHNYIGLSNSSVRVEILDNITIPEDIEIVDWYLFTILLSRGYHAFFTSSTSTHYRQHYSNILGFHKLDENNINFIAKKKYLHYLSLQEISEYHKKKFKEFSELLIKLDDPFFKKEYLRKMNDQMPKHPLWFEAIKPA